MKSKKAQVYILTAIILLSLAFFFTMPSSELRKQPSNELDELYNNFIGEYPKVINTALVQNKNITKQFSLFVSDFKDYAESRNAEFDIFYILFNGTEAFVENKFGSEVSLKINPGDIHLTFNDSETQTFQGKTTFRAETEDDSYLFYFNEKQKIQFKGVIKIKKDKDVQIYNYD